MREGEEEMDISGPTPRALMEVAPGPTHKPPRIKSAHSNQEMAETMDSIRQLQNSLHQSQPAHQQTTKQARLNSATGFVVLVVFFSYMYIYV